MNKIAEFILNEEDCSVGNTIDALLESDAMTATKYISDKMVVRASMKLAGKKLPAKNARTLEIVVTIGAPNYEAREFIKVCKKAKEPFPVKKIQLKFPRKK
jgi:hypothetical protein